MSFSQLPTYFVKSLGIYIFYLGKYIINISIYLQILEQEALDKAEEKKADEAAKLEKDAKKEASDAAPKEASKTEDAMETDAKKEGDEKKEDGEESG